jgi:hypothetical protein
MAKFRTHYDSLNVSHNAPPSVIKAAYKVLCQKYHPDKYAGGQDEALRIMKVINTAYAVLSDSGKRAEHDRWIERQNRACATDEAQRIMQIITKNYVPPSVAAKKSTFTVYAAIINKLWKNICSAQAKAQFFTLQILKKSSGIFWLTGIVGIVSAAIILHKSGIETTAVVKPVNQELVRQLEEKAGQLLKNGQVEQALSLYLQLASLGNADAQFNAGLIYANGQGIAKDDKQAVDWFSKAANQGHREAQTKLGFMYATGKGVAQNFNSAVNWCYKAAEQGDVIAQYNLGQMYAKGQGVAKDNNLAFSWFSKAAAQGDARAQHSLGDMYANGTGVPKDSRQAADLYRKAAKQGLDEAVVALKQLNR